MYRFMSLYVFFSLVVPFAIVGIPTYLLETWVVLQILLSFYLGGYVANKVGPSCTAFDYQRFLVPSRSTVTIIFFIFLALRSRHVLELVRELLSGDVAAWMLANAVSRYDGSLNLTIFDQLGTIVFFIFCALYGARFVKQKGDYYIHFALLVALGIESLSLARAGVLLGLSFAAAEIVIRANKVLSTATLLYFRNGLIALVGLLGVFGFSAYFRVAGTEDVAQILLEKLLSYTVAMYEAAYIWMSRYSYDELALGFNSFTAFYKLFGVDVPQGFYTLEYTQYGKTNIYTGIRGFVSDFGVVGTSLLMFLSGFMLRSFSRKGMGTVAYFFIRCVIINLIFILIPPFSFTTAVVAFVISWAILILPRPRPRKIQVKEESLRVV